MPISRKRGEKQLNVPESGTLETVKTDLRPNLHNNHNYAHTSTATKEIKPNDLMTVFNIQRGHLH